MYEAPVRVLWYLFLFKLLPVLKKKQPKNPKRIHLSVLWDFILHQGYVSSFQMKEALCVCERQREGGKSVSGGVFACVYLCVFLAGCVLGFHYTRTLPPGALSLSRLLCFCENTLGIRWAAVVRRKRRGGWGSDWRLKGWRGAQACCDGGERGTAHTHTGRGALRLCTQLLPPTPIRAPPPPTANHHLPPL